MQPKPNKRSSFLCWFWILFQAGWGAALAVILVWGPLSLDGWPVWAAGVAGALLMGLLWFRAGRKLRMGLHVFNLGVILAFGVAAFSSLYIAGIFPPPASDRVANFERFWRAMDAVYPYFELKGVDWDAVYEANAPRVAAAESEEAYRQIVAEILSELDDLHTRVNGVSSPMACCFAVTTEIDGQAVVTRSGAQATEAGLVPGAQIVAVDGRPVEERVQDYLQRYGSGSPGSRQEAFIHLLALYDGNDALTVNFIDVQGQEQSVVLRFTEPSQPAEPEPDSAPLITAERLDSGIAVIRIPTFSNRDGHDLVAEFDAALDSVFNAPGLILDLRGNGGGSTMYSDRIAGRFFDETFVYGREYFRHRLPQRLWRSQFNYTVKSRAPMYTGPVAVITDWTNASTAENFLAAMVDSGRAFIVGQTTAGSSGNPIHFQLPGGDCQFSTGDFHRLNGLSIEGRGFDPDIPIQWSVEDLVQGRDSFIDAAEEALMAGSR